MKRYYPYSSDVNVFFTIIIYNFQVLALDVSKLGLIGERIVLFTHSPFLTVLLAVKMFKVESTGVSQGPSALSLNGQSNFDFELSFCDDGTTDDLFDTFANDGASERSNGGRAGSTGSSSGSLAGSTSSPMDSGASSGNPADVSHIKIESDDSDMMITPDLPSSGNSPAVCSSAIDPSSSASSPMIVQHDSVKNGSETGPSDSTTPSPPTASNSIGGTVTTSGSSSKKGKSCYKQLK